MQSTAIHRRLQMETNELEKRDSSKQLSEHTGLIKYTFKDGRKHLK